jgi:hypothetical protein
VLQGMLHTGMKVNFWMSMELAWSTDAEREDQDGSLERRTRWLSLRWIRLPQLAWRS